MEEACSFLAHFIWKQMSAASPHRRPLFMSIDVNKAHKYKAGKSQPVLCPKEADAFLSQWQGLTGPWQSCSAAHRRKHLITGSTHLRQDGAFPECWSRSSRTTAEERQITSVCPSKRPAHAAGTQNCGFQNTANTRPRVLGTGMQHLLQMWNRPVKYSRFPAGCKSGMNSPPLKSKEPGQLEAEASNHGQAPTINCEDKQMSSAFLELQLWRNRPEQTSCQGGKRNPDGTSQQSQWINPPIPLQWLAWITNPSTRQSWHSPVSPARGWLTVKMNVPSLWYYYLITMACMSNPSNKRASLYFSWQQQPPAARETSQPTQVSVRAESSFGIQAKGTCPSWAAGCCLLQEESSC